MKKVAILLAIMALFTTANAQVIGKYSKPQGSYTIDENGRMVKKEKRGLFDRNKESKVIDEKYLVGACPEVGGRIQWDKSFDVKGKTARQIYDAMLPFMQAFCRSNGMTDVSNVSVVNEEDCEIGAKIQEWIIFENKPLSLDRTKFNYHMIVKCFDGRCVVSLRNMSYIYEEDRGGGQFPAEEMISDAEALNKKKNGFIKGGARKFRTKTIDRKDQIFQIIAEHLKEI